MIWFLLLLSACDVKQVLFDLHSTAAPSSFTPPYFIRSFRCLCPCMTFYHSCYFFLCWQYCNYAVANRLLATCWQPFFFSVISPKKIQSLFCVNLASGHCCPDTFVADSHYPPLMRASFHLFCTQDHSRWSPVAVAASLGMDHFSQWSMLRWLLVSVPQGNDWFE